MQEWKLKDSEPSESETGFTPEMLSKLDPHKLC